MTAVCKLCFYPLRGKREMKEGICRYCLPSSNQKFTEEKTKTCHANPARSPIISSGSGNY